MSKILVQYEADVSKFKSQLTDLSKEMESVEDTAVKGGDNITKSFDKTAEKTKSLKSQLKDLKAELANATDPKDIERLSKAAGEVGDKLKKASESAAIFTSGSKFEQIGNALGGVGSKLRSLDFEGAAEDSALLVSITKSITFKEAVTGVKALGTTLFNIGKSLLLNPIFLIGTAVAIIISNFDKLKNSGGFVGKMFSGIGNIIKYVIDKFTELTDAIGLTDTKSSAIADSIIRSYERIKNATDKRYESEIAAAKRAGKDSELIEIQKVHAIAKANDKIIEQLRIRQKALIESGGTVSDDDKKRLEELVEDNRKANIKILDLYASYQTRKKEEDKKRREDYKKHLEELSALDKSLRDLRTANIAGDEARKLKLIDDAFNDEAAKYKNNAAILIELEIKRQRDIEAVKQEGRKKEEDEYQKRIDAQAAFNKSRLDAAIKAEEDIDNALNAKINQSLEDNIAKYDEYIKAKQDADNAYIQFSIGALGQINQLFANYSQNRIDKINEDAESEISAQQQNYERGIISKEEFEKRKLKIDEDSKKKEGEIKRRAFLIDQNIAVLQAIMNTAVAVTSALKQPFPLNVALVAAATGQGALQIALIKSQQPPKFAKGVVGLKGKGTRTSDENLALISRDESVITADGTDKHRGLLVAINKGKGHDYLKQVYLAPALKAQKQQLENQQSADLASNIAKAIMFNSSQFKDENIVNALKTLRKSERESAMLLLNAFETKNNKYRY